MKVGALVKIHHTVSRSKPDPTKFIVQYYSSLMDCGDYKKRGYKWIDESDLLLVLDQANAVYLVFDMRTGFVGWVGKNVLQLVQEPDERK